MSFDLNSISKTKRINAPKILVSGQVKLGKSTFASMAPNPIFIQTEDGLSGIDAKAFPLATSLEDVYAAINTLLTEDHDFKTVVLDSADWTSSLVEDYVCRKNKWSSVEDPGYGRGHAACAAEWRTLIDGLEALRNKRDMAVIIICHVKVTRIESPTHDGYDAYTLKTHAKVASMLEEYADILAFCAHKIRLKTTDSGFGQKEVKAKNTGERILHLEAHPAYPSGNRFGLVDCALDWAEFAAQLESLKTN
jgi:hypothetical protein